MSPFATSGTGQLRRHVCEFRGLSRPVPRRHDHGSKRPRPISMAMDARNRGCCRATAPCPMQREHAPHHPAHADRVVASGAACRVGGRDHPRPGPPGEDPRPSRDTGDLPRRDLRHSPARLQDLTVRSRRLHARILHLDGLISDDRPTPVFGESPVAAQQGLLRSAFVPPIETGRGFDGLKREGRRLDGAALSRSRTLRRHQPVAAVSSLESLLAEGQGAEARVEPRNTAAANRASSARRQSRPGAYSGRWSRLRVSPSLP